jgi:arylsulfatase A-like enzyme
MKKIHPNILFIVMDTVRADHLSCYGYHRHTTPNIDTISHEGALFLKAFSPAPWTLPSHASMFTGLYPSQHGAGWEYKHLDMQFSTLAEYLVENGYRTAGFSENPFVSESYGLAQGFQSFYRMYGSSNKPIGLPLTREAYKLIFYQQKTREYARDTVNYCKTWILKHNSDEKPFFVFINFMAAHLPNYPRSENASRDYKPEILTRIEPINQIPERFYLPQYKLSRHELDALIDLYDGDLMYLDHEICRLLEFLRQNNILDNTILVITSDHGENFGDHGLIEHQFCLYNSLLHVPLIVRFPQKVQKGLVVREKVSTIFLFKTISDWIGIEGPNSLYPIESRSLFDNSHDAPIYAEYDNAVEMLRNVIGEEAPPDFDFRPYDKSIKCIYDGDYKLVLSTNGNNEIYRISNDFNENKNLINSKEEKHQELLDALMKWHTGLSKPPHKEMTPTTVDSETKDALRSLGYVK